VGLTEEGRRATLAFLKVSQLPSRPKPTWASLKKSLLLAPALGLHGPGTALAKDDALRAALLTKTYDLPLGECPELKQAKAEWTRKILGIGEREKITLETVQAALLRRESGEDRPAAFKKALDQLLAKRLTSRRADPKEFREEILRSWIDESLGKTSPARPSPGSSPCEPAPASPPPAPFDLESFARRVLAAGLTCPTGRYGDNKIFVVHVWRVLENEPEFRGMDLAGFKRHLAEANNARLLDLSRADLVQAMDPDDVRLSEVSYLNATFHFIRIGSERH